MVTPTSDIAVDAIIDELGEPIDTGISLTDPQEVAPRLSTDTGQKVTIYSTLDGEPREILRIDAPRVLKKRFPDGSRAFWYKGMPGEAPEYKRGQVQCMLHPDFDETSGAAGFDRTYIDDIGLTGRTCNMMAPDNANRGDFKSVYDRDDHMAKKHQREWRTIEDALEKGRVKLEADERRLDREATQRQGDALLAMAAGATTAVPEAATTAVEEVIQFICDVEDCGEELLSDVGLARHKRMTRDEAHRQARGE